MVLLTGARNLRRSSDAAVSPSVAVTLRRKDNTSVPIRLSAHTPIARLNIAVKVERHIVNRRLTYVWRIAPLQAGQSGTDIRLWCSRMARLGIGIVVSPYAR